MDSWGDHMPLPDADKRSPRVYTNLQNLDLANVTFSNIESTGDPIAIEEANEDELRRLVLVNLARLVCAGEWDGLLSAGGGGGIAGPLGPSPADVSDGSGFMLTGSQAGWGGLSSGQCVINVYPILHAFVSQVTGDLASISVNVTTGDAGTEGDFGIYSDADGFPDSLLGYATIDLSSTGEITQTSLSATISLVRGTQYWVAHTRSAAGGGYAYIDGLPNERTAVNAPASMGVYDSIGSNGEQNALILSSFAATTSLPATITNADYSVDGKDRPNIGLKW